MEDQIYKCTFYEDYRKSRNFQATFSMKFGIDLPPQQRVYAGFFVYSFCMGSLPPRLPDTGFALRPLPSQIPSPLSAVR